jgi:AraC-like DNA-binding protein
MLPISEIASSCGFADQSHLTRVFRRRVGATPRGIRIEGQA